MRPPSIARREPQPERLADHVQQASREVEREKQPSFLQALEPVMPSGAHEVLEPRTVALARPPREPAHGLAARHGHLGQLPQRARDLHSVRPAGGGPALQPAGRQVDLGRRGRGEREEDRQLVPGAVGPHRPVARRQVRPGIQGAGRGLLARVLDRLHVRTGRLRRGRQPDKPYPNRRSVVNSRAVVGDK